MHNILVGFSAVLFTAFSSFALANDIPADKNLVNDWVKYKLVTQETTQQGEAFQSTIIDSISSDDPTAIQKLTDLLNTFAKKTSYQFKAIQPKHQDMQELIALNEKNTQIALKVLPQHYKIMQSAHDQQSESQDGEAHFTEFMEASKVTAELAEQEQKIEQKVLQYLKENPL